MSPSNCPDLWRERCSRRRDRLWLVRSSVGLVAALGLTWTIDAQAGPPITIVNALPPSTVCPGGNSVSIFAPGQQIIQPGGPAKSITGDFASFPGLGIQVNNWY